MKMNYKTAGLSKQLLANILTAIAVSPQIETYIGERVEEYNEGDITSVDFSNWLAEFDLDDLVKI